MEPIEVGHTAGFFCGVMEQCKAVAAEVGPVVIHLQGVADILPLLAVETVAERSFVGAVAEVAVHAQPNLTSIPAVAPTRSLSFFHLTSFNLFANAVALIHRLLHDDKELAILFLHTYEAVAVLEAGETGNIAILQL